MQDLRVPANAHPVVKIVADRGGVGTEELEFLLRKYYRNPRDINYLSQEGRIAWLEERQCWIPGPRAFEY